MSDFKINNVEPNAHKSWLKEAFDLIKRNFFFFFIVSCLFFITINSRPFEYPMVMFSVVFFSIFSVILGLKSDHSISFWDTIKGFSFEKDGFFSCCYSAWKTEILFSLFSFIALLPFYFLSSSEKEEFNISFITIIISIMISLSWIAGSFFRHFHFQFNLFFQNLTHIEFKNLFLDDVFKNTKPINFLLLSNFIFGFFLFISSFSLPTSIEKTMIMTALGCLLFFLKIVEFVAFREIFQGRGKNKEVKIKVNESQLTPIKIKSN